MDPQTRVCWEEFMETLCAKVSGDMGSLERSGNLSQRAEEKVRLAGPRGKVV